MDVSKYYMSLPVDMSGSVSKNRFRFEVMWGLDKAFSIYNDYEEFVIVFDYVCDIEVHTSGRLYLYQVKTVKNKGYYPINKLIKKGNTEKSILGKLLINVKDEHDSIELKLALVSNVFLKAEKIIYERDEIKISELPVEIVEKICSAVCEENKEFQKKDIKSIIFIRTPNSIENIEEEMIGKTVKFYKQTMKQEPKKPLTLFNTFSLLATNKAAYENKCDTYDQLIRKKGISKKDIDTILSEHKSCTDVSIEKVSLEIDKLKSFNEKVKYKKALSMVKRNIEASVSFGKLEQTIKQIAEKMLPSLSGSAFESAIYINDREEINFPIEINNEERIIFILLVLKRMEENYYEENDC